MNRINKAKILLSATILSFTASNLSAETVVQGFGEDIPLSYAIEQIVPDSHVVSYGKNVNVNKNVSWNGGKHWKVVLENLAIENQLTIRTDQDNIIVRNNLTAGMHTKRGFDLVPYGDSNFEATIRKDSYADDIMGNKPGFVFGGQIASTEQEPVVSATTPAPENKNTDGFGIVDYQEEEPIEITNPPLPDSIYIGMDNPSNYQPDAETWEVFSGTTLEDLLMDWGERAGWKVVWNSDYSYPIVADAEFKGDFTSVASKIIRSMAKAKPPVRGEFYKGNNVLVVNTILDGQS
jgi:hypothetical protein